MEHLELKKLPQENARIEYKKCADTLPKSIWETYSSFSNTEGGVIVLGVTEKGKRRIVTGVVDVDRVLKDFWNTLSNPEKISYNSLVENDIMLESIDDKTVILINVPEASFARKPIYLNNNLKKTYIREYESDRLATEDQVRAFVRNSGNMQDSILLDGYIEEDLDNASIEQYRRLLADRTGDEKYLTMGTRQFLINIGVMQMDHADHRKYKITEGGLLFLGKYESIISHYPHYHLDFLDRRGGTDRWNDRIASGDLEYPNLNVFSYYLLVSEKLKQTLWSEFALDEDMIRKSSKLLETALREALMNMLIHADYHEDNVSLAVNVYDGYYTFTNPGILRVTKEEFFWGGKSNPRNNVLITLFRRAGLSERAGTGGAKIWEAAEKNRFNLPECRNIIRVKR